MIKKNKLLSIFIITFMAGNSFSESPKVTWDLPMSLSDENTKVGFEVDSTWHLVKGTTAGIKGEASLTDKNDSSSVKIYISLPVEKFDTDNGMRDSKMKKVMHADKSPLVIFEGQGLTKKCTPEILIEKESCEDLIFGTLTINSTKKNIKLPVEIKKNSGNQVSVAGNIIFNWLEYGIEDPSILIAKVRSAVKVLFEVKLKIKNL